MSVKKTKTSQMNDSKTLPEPKEKQREITRIRFIIEVFCSETIS